RERAVVLPAHVRGDRQVLRGGRMMTTMFRTRAVVCALGALAVAACTEPPAQEPPAKAKGDVELLSGEEHLVRIAMALKGVRPKASELERVRNDPDAIEAIVDDYMESPEFGATIREMHGEQWLTNVDPVFFPAGFRPLGALAGMDSQALNTSVTESPGRFVEH